MPDGDVISRTIPHAFRSTYARLRAGATPAEIAPHLNRALAETLRKAGGIPGQVEYGALLEAHARGELTATEARAEVERVYKTQPQIQFDLMVRRAVERRISAPLDGVAILQPGSIAVVEAVCVEIANTQLFERARPALVGERFADHEALDRVVEQCHRLVAPSVARIGASLSQDPSAARLRAAPNRRRVPRQSTATLLKQSVL